ncbi:hypothetical protein KORDIASMS9_04362 [Kordia sp. SMS9]|uniref:hypothetical protein n=1 Tax=Kordia sp. SMS9 TaxID=2282170 RepID=UPI000E0DFDFD|nr:hypothetical protein [Kordia sp. SMS9]AXG72099.1 hypothetical protein KORDIASMS9_04362 [Kordia sp. SMS9]
MKKIVFLFAIACTFFSCDDGDLTVEEIDLETTATVEACTSDSGIPAGVTLLFKINGTETVILEAPSNLYINEVTETDMPRTATLNSDASSFYRSFDTSITSGYFCDELPSDIPITLEYTAVAGTVEVTTTEVLDSDTMEITGYKHNTVFIDVVFTGTNGQDVRYGEFVFGEMTTVVE